MVKSDSATPTLTGAPARVARVLLESGPATASQVCVVLNLTGTAVRRHLDSLVLAGYAEANESAPFGPTRPKGRGRPARVYSLTDAGRNAFDQGYDDLAIAALSHLAAKLGDEAVVEFARARAAEMESRYAPALEGATTTAERTTRLAEALNQDGFVTTTEANGDVGVQLCQHNCPVAHVAQEFPQLCEAETEAFSRLVGTHVARLAALSHGDGICTTLIPVRIVQSTQHATHDERTSA